jgi:hypothetical protein
MSLSLTLVAKLPPVSLILWCTLIYEYLSEFSKEFEMTLMLLSGAWGKMIQEKPEAKNLVTLSLYDINHDKNSAKFNEENWTGGWPVVHENGQQWLFRMVVNMVW